MTKDNDLSLQTEWRSIPGFPGYLIARDGRVLTTRRNQNRLLSVREMPTGRYVSINRNSVGEAQKGGTHRVASLLALAFLGVCPETHALQITSDSLEGLKYVERVPWKWIPDDKQEDWKSWPRNESYWVRKDGKLWSSLSPSDRPMEPGFNVATGYASMYFTFSGEPRKAYAVHAVVAETWIGKRPTSEHVIDHADGDRLNNSVCNLRYVTRSENSRHRKSTYSPRVTVDVSKLRKQLMKYTTLTGPQISALITSCR